MNNNNKINKYISYINKNYNLNNINLFNTDAGYYQNLISDTNDKSLFDQLKKELIEEDKLEWASGRHYKYDNPLKYPTFKLLIEKLSNIFNINITEYRLNYYENGKSYKNYHQDKIIENQNITIGLSLGCKRELSFKHINSNIEFSFPQNNGDVFFFNNSINENFLHGIPISNTNDDRISIILWGYYENDFNENINNIYKEKEIIIQNNKKIRWRKK